MTKRKMKQKFVTNTKSHLLLDHKVDEMFLGREKLLKTQSLLLSSHASVLVPPTLLLLERNKTVLKDIINRWKMPLMIRMDYKSLPNKKTMGGIPLYTYKAINRVCRFLFKEKCYPILHPYFDRFADKYSVGILLKPSGFKCLIEIVGEGFDASDLRLGAAHPHEVLEIDISSNSILNRSTISKSDYKKERQNRIQKIIKLKRYIEYVNEKGNLLSSLDVFDEVSSNKPRYEVSVPKDYKILPTSYLNELNKIIFVLHSEVIKKLPSSTEFIASLSYIKEGWILWDIYGQWYSR